MRFADVSPERQALYYEALIQHAARSEGVVRIESEQVTHIDRLHEVGEVLDEIDTIVREYVPGYSLRELSAPALRHHLTRDRCLAWLSRISSTLAHVHLLGGVNDQPLGVIHRDVTWDNILISDDELSRDTPGQGVYLNDFGLAYVTAWGKLPLEDTLQGSPHFLSPELKAGQQPTSASDVYQAGLTLAALLNTIEGGELAALFDEGFSNPASELAKSHLRAFGAESCLEHNPNLRPTASELAALLSR